MTLSSNQISLPRGVSDFLPDAAAKIGYVEGRIRRVFELWGFRRIITPKLEYEDILAMGMGEGLKGKTFRFDDRQTGRLLAFPPDITPQIARIAATRLSAQPLPHRICYSGRVLRQAEKGEGRSREIFQSGVELIGLDSPEADAEMVAMAIEALQASGVENFKIDLGQVEFCRGILDGCPLSGIALADLRDSLARKDASAVAALLERENVAESVVAEVMALPKLFGGLEIIDEAARAVANPRSRRALENLCAVLEILDIHGLGEYLSIDLGETRGLEYHTGVTFEGFVPGVGEPVCSGGRYDTLTERYGLSSPATGFTFNILTLLQALERRPDVEASTTRDFLIFNSRDDRRGALEVAKMLRACGFSTARDIIRREYEHSLDYARRTGIRCMIVVAGGAEEIICSAVRVRDGQTLDLTRDDLKRTNLMNHIEEYQGV